MAGIAIVVPSSGDWVRGHRSGGVRFMLSASFAAFFTRFALLSLAAATASAARSETLTSPGTGVTALVAMPFSEARAPLLPEEVRGAAGTAAKPVAASWLFKPAPARVMHGPLLVGGTTGLGVLELIGSGGRLPAIEADAVVRQAAVKSVEPKAKFIWLR